MASLGKKIARGFASDGKKSFWALADQALVSFGNFGVQLVLARYFDRHTSISDFGGFWLLMEPLMFLNSLHTAWLIYPLTIRGAVISRAELAWMAGTLTLLTISMFPLLSSVLLITGLIAGLPWQATAWASVAMCAWQLQELLRRGLMAQIRFRDALVGDAISYLGQVSVVAGLAYAEKLTLTTTFMAMAATSLLAACVQGWQLRIRFPALRNKVEITTDWRERSDPASFALTQYSGSLEAGGQVPISTERTDSFVPQMNDRSEYTRAAKECWRVGRWVIFGNLSGLLTGPMLTWNIAFWAGKELLGVAYAMANLLRFVNPLSFAISTLIMPHAAKAAGEKGMAAAKRTMLRFSTLGALLLAPYLGMTLLLPHLALALFYGRSSRYEQWSVMLQIATLASAVNYAITVTGALLNAVHRSRDTFIAQIVIAAAIVCLGIPLTAKYGLEGSWLATLIANCVQLGFHAYFIRRLHDNKSVEVAHEDSVGPQLLSAAGR